MMQIALKENWNVLLPKMDCPLSGWFRSGRTKKNGYPKILPNIINNSQGTVSTKDFIRRIPIPLKYRENNGPVIKEQQPRWEDQILAAPNCGGIK